MTPEILFQQTSDFYQSLIHPDLSDVDFQREIEAFRGLRAELDRELALTLIQESNWRTHLLGLAVGALLREWSLAPVVLDLIRQPTGISIVPAGAWLMVQHQQAPSLSPEIDGSESDSGPFGDEVGWVLTRLQAQRVGNLTVDPDEVGPNSGQSLQSQLALYERLCSEN